MSSLWSALVQGRFCPPRLEFRSPLPLAVELGREDADACGIAAGTCQGYHQSLPDHVVAQAPHSRFAALAHIGDMAKERRYSADPKEIGGA